MNKINVNDKDFQKEVIEKSKSVPIVVDFWASWCGPCRILKPTMEKLAEEYKGKFILAELNVEENQAKAQEFGVMSIPSVKLFKDGKIVDEFVGAQPESQIVSWLDKNSISK